MAEAADDIRANLEKQIADLKKEVSRMSKSLASRASDVMDDAEETYEEGKHRARKAVANVREQANLTVDAMRENPVTTATVLTSAGLVGVAAGFVLAGLFAGDRRR